MTMLPDDEGLHIQIPHPLEKIIALTEDEIGLLVDIDAKVSVLPEVAMDVVGFAPVLASIDASLKQLVAILTPSPSSSATRLTLTLTGDPMSTFTVDTTTGVATLQFKDDHNDDTAGPTDSVTGAPIVPVVTSDNPATLTVALATPDPSGAPGKFDAALTMVAPGVSNLAVQELVNSDGSSVVDAAGQPLTLPAAIVVTVNPGPPVGLEMTVA